MIASNEVKSAVEVMDHADDTQWNEDGTPKLEVVRRLMSDETVTEDDIDEAMGSGFKRGPVDSAKAEGDGGSKGGVDLLNPPNQPPDDSKQPGAVPPVSVRAQVEAAKVKVAETKPVLDELQRKRLALDEEIAAATNVVESAQNLISEGTEQLSQAEMVKRIQKQTQDQAMKKAEDTAKINSVLKAQGIKNFSSPLDAALAAGGRRSTVLVNGKPVVAPHPRSPEGIKNYAAWVHSGARQAV